MQQKKSVPVVLGHYGRQSISRPMRIVAPMPQEGGPRILKKPDFLEKQKKSPKTQKLRNIQKYDKIRDTPFDQRSLIHREVWFPPCFVGQRILKNPIFLKNGKNHPKQKQIQNVQKYAKISDTSFDQKPQIHWEAWFPGGPRIPKIPAQKKIFMFCNFRNTVFDLNFLGATDFQTQPAGSFNILRQKFYLL